MNTKNIFMLIIFFSMLFISCTKDDPTANLEGKIIYAQVGTDNSRTYYIKDLKTNNIHEFRALPIVSLTGKKVAMKVPESGHSGVNVMDSSGKQVLYAFNEPSFYISDLLWAPDDNQLAMLSKEKNNVKIYDFTSRKISEIFLPESEVFVKFIGWSEKDNTIYFTSQNNKKEIFLSKIKPDGSGYLTFFKPQSHHLIGNSFDYHEGSDLIVFTYLDSINSLVKICKISTNGINFNTLYSKNSTYLNFFTHINISPNGEMISYQYDFSYAIYVMNIDGRNHKQLWSPAWNLQWSKDGTAAMASVRYHVEWSSSKWDIRIKTLDHPNDEYTIQNGPVNFYSWYFD